MPRRRPTRPGGVPASSSVAPGAFALRVPDTLLYTGTANASQLAGIEWNVASQAAPAGFAGTHDRWTESSPGVWTLRLVDHPPVRAPGRRLRPDPPLPPGERPGPRPHRSVPTSTQTEPLRILVSNDDGFAAAGIDAVVEALRRAGRDVTVVAPATNQSGAGEQTTDGPLTATSEETLSGYPATAVQGFPADAVIYALRDLHINPDLVVTGLNFGQNMGPLVNVSGTVGAARAGGPPLVPALATSQGFGQAGVSEDYPTGAPRCSAWVRDFRLGRAGPPLPAGRQPEHPDLRPRVVGAGDGRGPVRGPGRATVRTGATAHRPRRTRPTTSTASTGATSRSPTSAWGSCAALRSSSGARPPGRPPARRRPCSHRADQSAAGTPSGRGQQRAVGRRCRGAAPSSCRASATVRGAAGAQPRPRDGAAVR